MKKYFIYLSVALLAGFTACTDKEDENKENFSPLTVEQNKAKIEDSGIALVNEMQKMEEEPAMDVTASLFYFLENGSEPVMKKGELKKFSGLVPVYALEAFKTNGVEGTFKSLKSATEEVDPETLLDTYEALKGTFDWDYLIQGWVYTEGADAIIFNFPSTETGTENNATYTITYDGRVMETNIDGEVIMLDYPSELNAVLTVDDVTVMTYNFTMTYNSNDIPTSISSTLTVGEFSFNISASNTDNSKFAGGFTFKSGETILIKFELGVEGNWDPDFLEEQANNEDPTGIINNTNVLFQVVDIKIVGLMDVASMTAKFEEIINNGEPTTFEEEEAIVKDAIAEINKSVNLSVRYVADNSIISKAEFGYVIETDDYTGGKYFEPTIFFVFADGSKIDAEIYIETGFEDLFAQLEDMFESLEQQFN